MQIRDARPDEYTALGQLLSEAYAALPGFPGPQEQPQYYAMLADIGRFAAIDGARLLAAVLGDGTLAGGVVYFSRMAAYGSGGAAPQERNASG
ncbi:GNAT family N-acetyltransferase, partial [Oxalobacteraceae bacterium OM1]